MKLHGVIYKHTNKITNKSYIGQTIQVDNIQRRFRHSDSTHNSYKSCPAFFNALNKYGWAQFDTELLYSSFDQESLNKAEEYFINLYNSVAPNGYNSSMMVNGSVKFTEEIKKKISDSRKLYYSKLEVRPVGPNRKEHIFINSIEHKHCSTCEVVKPLTEYQKNSNRWDGLHSYCKPCANARRREYKYVGLSEEDFKKSYENRQNKEKQAELYNNEPQRRAIIAQQRSKAIIATHLETGVEVQFNSAKEAKQYGFDNTNIGLAIKNNKPYKKHTWRFK